MRSIIAGVWHPGSVQLPDRVVVEPDLSNAAPFLGAALIAGGNGVGAILAA